MSQLPLPLSDPDEDEVKNMIRTRLWRVLGDVPQSATLEEVSELLLDRVCLPLMEMSRAASTEMMMEQLGYTPSLGPLN